jgi:hypothetical protein
LEIIYDSSFSFFDFIEHHSIASCNYPPEVMDDLETLPTRPLGRQGPVVPRLGLGLMGASGMYGSPAGDEERLCFLRKAYERGERFWDTGKTEVQQTP